MPASRSDARAGRPALGAHVSLWASDSSTRETERAVAAANALDMDFVQVSLTSPQVDVGAVRNTLRRHGVGCVAGLAVPPDVWEGRRDGGLERFLTRAVDLTSGLGSNMLSGALYTPMGERGGADGRQAELEFLRGCLKGVARYAAERGVRLGLEPLNRYETSLVNTCDELLAFMDAIDEPNVFAQLDTFHMNIEEQDIGEAIVAVGERVGYVHLAEADRGVPGDGHLPWRSVFQGLRDIGYAGPLAFESFTVENKTLAVAARFWRDIVGDPDEFVRRGWQQMREQAEAVGYRL